MIETMTFDLSIILINYNTLGLLPEVLGALQSGLSKFSSQIIVVDNASRDDSVAFLQRHYPDIRLIVNEENVGFGRANNQALQLVSGRYVLLLNTDAFVSPDTLEKTIAYMDSHPQCGVLGVKLVGRDGELQPSCRYFPTPWNLFLKSTGMNRLFPWVRMMDDMSWNHASPRACDWVPGCYYLVRRELIQQIGLFDPRYFLYFEEIDHCLRAKQEGWEIHYFPDTTVTHIGGESAKSDGELSESGRQLVALQVESELLYFRKNHGVLGVWLNMALMTLANVIIPIKLWLKGRQEVNWKTFWQHTRLMWLIFRQTRWARQPTR